VIFPKRPLSLDEVARRWTRELKGTLFERDLDEVLAALVFAVAEGDLVPAEQLMQDALLERLGPVDEDTVFETDELIELAKLAIVYRAAFLDWAAKEGIQPYPKFWGEEPDYKEWAKRAVGKVQAPDLATALARKLVVYKKTETEAEEGKVTPAIPAETSALSPLDACVKQLLDEGYDPGSETCYWATFVLKVRERMPRQKGLSERNLHRAVRRVRSLPKLP
jgi:hypothetical protein